MLWLGWTYIKEGREREGERESDGFAVPRRNVDGVVESESKCQDRINL